MNGLILLNPMKNKLKLLLFFFKIIFFLPHLCLFWGAKQKVAILKDAEKTIKSERFQYKGVMAVMWLLQNDKYFRSLFYARVGLRSRIVSWIFKGESTFIPGCPSIGAGVYLAHPYATIINAKSIGENLSIRQCTTIGNKIDGRNDLVPTIGNNVTVGANVVIIGDIRIGNNVIIGAGSVVIRDVPDNCVVAGNPAKIIRQI